MRRKKKSARKGTVAACASELNVERGVKKRTFLLGWRGEWVGGGGLGDDWAKSHMMISTESKKKGAVSREGQMEGK